jgi:hypothetical protein
MQGYSAVYVKISRIFVYLAAYRGVFRTPGIIYVR